MNEVKKSLESYIMSSAAEDRAHKIKISHATDSCFQNVVTYKTYRLLGKLQTHNGKMATHTGRYVKRMKTLMKIYKLEDKNPITVFRFLAQIKRTCDLD